jgi:hypothetical protein
MQQKKREIDYTERERESELVKQTLAGSALSGLLHVPSDPNSDGGGGERQTKHFQSFLRNKYEHEQLKN